LALPPSPARQGRGGEQVTGIDHLIDAWPAYRLVTEGKATMQEVTTTMSLVECIELNHALDALAAAEARSAERARSK
jgi:hypothetical protein